MAAVYEWSESNGVGQVITDSISNLNFGSNDSVNIVPATYPIDAGNNSFEKLIRAKFSGVTFTSISNMKFWKSAGGYKVGESIKAIANQAYVQPVVTTSILAVSSVPESEGTALSIQEAGGVTGIISAPGYTKYLVLQLQTTGSTPAGAVNQKTFTFQYDEV